MVPISRPRGDPDGAGTGGTSQLHRAGRGRRFSLVAREIRHQDGWRGPRSAIHYAQRGIPNYEYMLRSIGNENTRKQWEQYPPGGVDVFYDDGDVPEPGSLLVQSGMAATLRKLVEAEIAAEGHRAEGVRAARESFYSGEVARNIVYCSHSVGGILDMDSLAGYEAKYETPIKTSFLGHEIHGQRTWTQSAVLMQAINILENFDLRAMGHNSTAYIHTVSQALNLAFADRQAYYGDPDFAEVPIDGLLSKEYARERAAIVDANTAFAETPEPGDPCRYSSTTRPFRNEGDANGAQRNSQGMPTPNNAASSDEVGTTHISVIDREGNMVAATPSGGSFSKSVFFPELGFALSTRMEMLNFEDGHPNRLEPGKRPRTTLINYIVSKDGVPVMTVGCPGGDHQAQANLQLILNSLLWGMNPQAAVEAPRFASNNVLNSFYPHSYFPGQLAVERGIPQNIRNELAAKGHDITRRRRRRSRSHNLETRPKHRSTFNLRRPTASLLRTVLVKSNPAAAGFPPFPGEMSEGRMGTRSTPFPRKRPL